MSKTKSSLIISLDSDITCQHIWLLLKLTDNISKELNNKQYSIGIFLDFSKAFDTINHDILVDTLSYYGIRGTALRFIKFFVTNRVQFVNLNDVKSE